MLSRIWMFKSEKGKVKVVVLIIQRSYGFFKYGDLDESGSVAPQKVSNFEIFTTVELTGLLDLAVAWDHEYDYPIIGMRWPDTLRTYTYNKKAEKATCRTRTGNFKEGILAQKGNDSVCYIDEEYNLVDLVYNEPKLNLIEIDRKTREQYGTTGTNTHNMGAPRKLLHFVCYGDGDNHIEYFFTTSKGYFVWVDIAPSAKLGNLYRFKTRERILDIVTGLDHRYCRVYGSKVVHKLNRAEQKIEPTGGVTLPADYWARSVCNSVLQLFWLDPKGVIMCIGSHVGFGDKNLNLLAEHKDHVSRGGSFSISQNQDKKHWKQLPVVMGEKYYRPFRGIHLHVFLPNYLCILRPNNTLYVCESHFGDNFDMVKVLGKLDVSPLKLAERVRRKKSRKELDLQERKEFLFSQDFVDSSPGMVEFSIASGQITKNVFSVPRSSLMGASFKNSTGTGTVEIYIGNEDRKKLNLFLLPQYLEQNCNCKFKIKKDVLSRCLKENFMIIKLDERCHNYSWKQGDEIMLSGVQIALHEKPVKIGANCILVYMSDIAPANWDFDRGTRVSLIRRVGKTGPLHSRKSEEYEEEEY